MAVTARPKASAIGRMPMGEDARVGPNPPTTTEPQPMKHRVAVPTNSARYFFMTSVSPKPEALVSGGAPRRQKRPRLARVRSVNMAGKRPDLESQPGFRPI